MSIRRASAILTVSNYSRETIAQRGRLDPSRIGVVYHAPNPDLQPPPEPSELEELRAKLQLSPSFVLADALKNPQAVIRAWRLLPNDLMAAAPIVFFSRASTTLPIVGEAVSRGEARLLLRPSRRELIGLYHLASVFFFPSWVEGFGIPLLEAMSAGTPIVASNRGAIPEVAGDAALLSDAEDVNTQARHLEALLSDPRQADELRARGTARLRRFSWERSARQNLNAYLATLGRPPEWPVECTAE